MSLFCVFGVHKYSVREIHVAQKIEDDHMFYADILERCDCCGKSAITGAKKKTILVIPTKYASTPN